MKWLVYSRSDFPIDLQNVHMGVTLAVCWALAYIVFKGFGVNIYYFMHSIKMHKKISILGEPRFPYDPILKMDCLKWKPRFLLREGVLGETVGFPN